MGRGRSQKAGSGVRRGAGRARRQKRGRPPRSDVSAWGYLREICRWPDRLSTTHREREAADWVALRLREAGFDVRRQSFLAPAATLYTGPVLCGGAVALLALAASRWATGPWVVLAAALAWLAVLPLAGEVLGVGPNFDWVLPRRRSVNVVADLPHPPGGPAPAAEVVICAHIDTQRASWLFAPAFAPLLPAYFWVSYGALALSVLSVSAAALAPAWAGHGHAWRWGAGVGGLLAAVSVGWLGVAGLFGRGVNGANDNGSGVAVALALARRFASSPLDGVRLRWVFTGAEEVGSRGMAAFMRAEYPGRAGHGGQRSGLTLFVNLDNVGGGRLRALLREGTVLPVACGPTLRSVAEELAREQPDRLSLWRGMLLLPTDGVVAARRGYETLTLIGLDDRGRIPDYHWYTDTIDRVDPARLQAVEETVVAFLERLAARLGAQPEGR